MGIGGQPCAMCYLEYLQSGRVVYPHCLDGTDLGRGQATLPDCKLGWLSWAG